MHKDAFTSDAMHVAVPRTAGIDVHKMQVTVSMRLCDAGQAGAQVSTHGFEAHPAALQAMTAWLADLEVEAATIEGAGVYWIAPYRAVEQAGIALPLPAQGGGKPGARAQPCPQDDRLRGPRVGGVLSDVFGRNGRMVFDGLAAGCEPAEIPQGLA